MNIATISISKIGSYQIEYHAKGNIHVTIAEFSLQAAYKSFFKEVKKYGLTNVNTAFVFNWEGE